MRLRAAGQAPIGEGDSLMTGVSSVISQRSTPPGRQVEDLLKAYSRLPWLRSVVGKVGFSTAAVPWRLFYETTTRRARAIRHAQYAIRKRMIREKQMAGELVEIEDHPMLDLLENFNPMMTGLAGRKVTQHHIDLVGEGFWLKQRDGLGVPVGLWPLPPFWVRSTPTPAQPYFEISRGSWQQPVPASEIVWFIDLDPHQPYRRGTGHAAALGDELETDWKQRNRGLFKALQVYFLNRKVDVKQLGQSFRNLQLIQLREFERNMVIQVFGVPPEILGIIEKSNRATITAADYLFSRWVLVPRLELQRAVMQEHLVTDYDERLILDYESPVEEDEERQLSAAKVAPWALKVDEWRELQGQDPLPDGAGQVHMVPQNLIPMRSLAGAPPAQVQPGAPQALAGDTKGPRLVYDKDAIEDIEDQLTKLG